jgi:uncharacterized protein involved in outer membrane biogenesis
MKKLIVRILIVVVLLVVVGLVAGIFFIGNIIKTGVEKVGPVVTKVPVKLDSANISVFSGNGELKGFVLGNPEGFKSPEAIKVGTMSLSISPMSVLGDKVVIRSIKVLGPEISYETDLKGSNLGKILDNLGGEKPPGEKPPAEKPPGEKPPSQSQPSSDGKGAQKKLQVDEFIITGAKVHASAPIIGSYVVSVPEIKLANLGQGPDGITAAELGQRVMSALLEATTKAVADGATKGGKGVEGQGTDALKKGVGDFLKKK